MTTEKGSQGNKTGHQGREELAALNDEELFAQAAAYGVSTTADDGSAVDRQEVVNALANKVRQGQRKEDKAAGKTADDATS